MRNKKSILNQKNTQDLKLDIFRTKISEIFRELKINYKKAKFASFCDGVFSYEYKTHSVLYEFLIIADDTFLDKMTPKSLIEQKRIKYFCFSEYKFSDKEQNTRTEYSEDND